VSREAKDVFKAINFQGDTALTISPFFNNAGRGTTKILGEMVATLQPTAINWGCLNKTEQQQLETLLTTSDTWILLTHPLGNKIMACPSFWGAKKVAIAEGKPSRHKRWHGDERAKTISSHIRWPQKP